MEIRLRSVPRRLLGIRGLETANPWVVLVPLLVAQWLALLAFALTVRHNGWLFYQGGDETFYYTTAWTLSGWHLPTTPIGFGWPYLLSPLALFAGPNILHALPAIVVLNTLVLLPLAALCVYGVAARIGGRLVGYLAALGWVIGPYAAIPLWDPRYHQKWVELFLPQGLGLTALADFPSTVCLLVAAYFCLRALDGADEREGLAAGLAAAFAAGLKPANTLFLAAPVVAFLLARRWRQLGAFAAAAAPALLALAVWKSRGVGSHLLVAGDSHLAYLARLDLPLAFQNPITRYVQIHWDVLGQNLDAMREFFWSVRPLEYLPIAGAVAVAFRSLPKGAFLTTWFFGYFFIKGSSHNASVEDGSFFRLMMPALPPYLLLAASIPLLAPVYGPALAERAPPAAPRRLGTRRLVAAALVFALVPLLVVSLARPLRSPAAVKDFADGLFLPVDSGFRARATVQGTAVLLRWPARNGSAVATFYRVLRGPAYRATSLAGQPIAQGVSCASSTRTSVLDCFLNQTIVAGTTAARSLVDRPGPGRWTYYVAMASNWLDDPSFGDPLLLSSPVTVTVAR